jgi:hypothetical protein
VSRADDRSRRPSAKGARQRVSTANPAPDGFLRPRGVSEFRTCGSLFVRGAVAEAFGTWCASSRRMFSDAVWPGAYAAGWTEPFLLDPAASTSPLASYVPPNRLVRGRLASPGCHLRPKRCGKRCVPATVGRGILLTVRFRPEWTTVPTANGNGILRTGGEDGSPPLPFSSHRPSSSSQVARPKDIPVVEAFDVTLRGANVSGRHTHPCTAPLSPCPHPATSTSSPPNALQEYLVAESQACLAPSEMALSTSASPTIWFGAYKSTEKKSIRTALPLDTM